MNPQTSAGQPCACWLRSRSHAQDIIACEDRESLPARERKKSGSAGQTDDSGSNLSAHRYPARPCSRQEPWPLLAIDGPRFDLPEWLAVVIAEQKFILAVLDLAREDRVHTLELHLDAGDFQQVALMESQVVLVDELGQR